MLIYFIFGPLLSLGEVIAYLQPSNTVSSPNLDGNQGRRQGGAQPPLTLKESGPPSFAPEWDPETKGVATRLVGSLGLEARFRVYETVATSFATPAGHQTADTAALISRSGRPNPPEAEQHGLHGHWPNMRA